MDSEMQAALAGAVVGAIVGGLLTFCAQGWFERGARRRNARHVAIRVVSILDAYIQTCVQVVTDDGLCQGQRNEQGCLVAQVSTPPPPSFPDDLDWKSIDHKLMYRLILMPNEAKSANDKIDFLAGYSDPPDYEEFFEERQDQYSTIGLTAFELAQELRKSYGIPAKKFGDWNPVERLREAKRTVTQDRKQRFERLAAMPVPTI